MGVPWVPWSLAGWLISENPIEMNDNWGYLHFRKPPYIYILWIYHTYVYMYVYIYIQSGNQGQIPTICL